MVHARPAREATTAWIATDGKSLFVRFEALQREPIVATQHTNDVGQGSDDAVWVDLWPGGPSGYMYQFQATPNGTHYQSSSENTAYSPTWESRGAVKDEGYTVTMRIPLGVLRGVSSSRPWKAQFVRQIQSTGEQEVWSFDVTQTNADDVAKAGAMTLPQIRTAGRPSPRVAAYALAAVAASSIGGSTSRVGADISIPVTPTASFYATLHPDYSNVELDQQSIVPTVAPRFYSEVRPFFTQGASLFNYNLHCFVCGTPIDVLYTPAIPTPREGYAVEGKEGALSFAALDAIGDGRSDLASTLDYVSPNQNWNATVEHVSANAEPVIDNATVAALDYTDLKHIQAYASYGADSGTNVLEPNQGRWLDSGLAWSSQNFAFFGGLHDVGQYFNPVDGYVFHPGIAGYALYAAKYVNFNLGSKLNTISLLAYLDRYQGPTYGQSQSDNQVVLDVLTRNAWDFQVFSGSDYWRFDSTLTPVSQSAGFQITYHSGLVTNNPNLYNVHGTSATPTTLIFNTGRYGEGTLNTWIRSSTLRVGTRGSLTVAVDDTAQYLPHGSNVQWFNSVSYAYQINGTSSFALGMRQVTGPPPVPNGGGNCTDRCSNVSLAYHLRMRHAEIYVAYGNPNALITVPQSILKLIFYAGADKGT